MERMRLHWVPYSIAVVGLLLGAEIASADRDKDESGKGKDWYEREYEYEYDDRWDKDDWDRGSRYAPNSGWSVGGSWEGRRGSVGGHVSGGSQHYPGHCHHDRGHRYYRAGRIPAGHLPPPGECRVWFYDRPAGHQPPPTSCWQAERTVPYGATVVYGSGVAPAPVYGRYREPLPQRAPEYDYRGDGESWTDPRDRERAPGASGEYPDTVPPQPRYEESPRVPPTRIPSPPVIELPSPGESQSDRSSAPRPLFPPGEQTLVLDGVEFENDSIDLTREAMWTLDGVAQALLDSPELIIEIGGHSDSKGDKDYNRFLSLIRAEEVRDYLVSKGIDSARLYVRGYGESEPIASNRTKAGRALNRRVELRRLDFEARLD